MAETLDITHHPKKDRTDARRFRDKGGNQISDGKKLILWRQVVGRVEGVGGVGGTGRGVQSINTAMKQRSQVGGPRFSTSRPTNDADDLQ